jgi:hypothetical protein
MGKSFFSRAILTLVLVLSFAACAPKQDSILPTEKPEVLQANLVISSAEVEWSELIPPDPCTGKLPSPVLHLCVQNQGNQTASLEYAYLAMPAEFAPAVQANILNSLPGGNWKPAEFIPIDGLPGADSSTQGIIIVNTMPGPDSEPEGIIIINNLPGAFSGAEGIIIVNTMPGPSNNGEGIIIVNNLPGDEASQVMGIIMEDKPGEDGSSEGIVIVNVGIPPGITPPPDDSIVWGGIVWGGLEGLTGDIEGLIPLLRPPPDDSSEGIVWGGLTWGDMPAVEGVAQGIVIVNTMPGPDSGAEGIIVVNGLPGFPDINQVMGIIMEDKPGEDGSSEGIVIVNVGIPPGIKPPPDDGIVWGGIVWGGLSGEDGSSKGIIIVDSLPASISGAESAVWTGMPFGFEMGEGMMAMMGEGGFGPGPYLLGKLELSKLGFPAELGAGEESCNQASLLPIGSENLGGPNSSPPADSFFEVFVEIENKQPKNVSSASTAITVVQVPYPSLPFCTPASSEILPTATPTRSPSGPPTNTPYARPTNTPVYVRPTSTPKRVVPTPAYTPRN